MIDCNKILIGSSIQLPEVEEDDYRDIIGDAEIKSDFLSVLNVIGRPEFKEVYNLFSRELKKQPIELQASFAREILDKIEEVYEYRIPLNFVFDLDVANDVFELLEFLEFKHVEFLSNVWSKLGVDLVETDILKYCTEQSNFVGKAIMEVAKSIMREQR